MILEEIDDKLRRYRDEGRRMFVTSSFQTQSIPLLHIVSGFVNDIDVLFINTGFHFPETLIFRDQVAGLWNLNVTDICPLVPKSQQKDSEGQLYFIADPDYCCYLNKVQPLEPYLMQYDVWISGIRADQGSVRDKMQVEEPAPFNTIRFHPMLDWTAKKIFEYRQVHQLPAHPLDSKGYNSIGCAPCTRKHSFLNERSARWFGMKKTECGLHTELIKRP